MVNQVLDRYFGNVCELDLIFNFHKAYYILDELLVAGALFRRREGRRRGQVIEHVQHQGRQGLQKASVTRPALSLTQGCLPGSDMESAIGMFLQVNSRSPASVPSPRRLGTRYAENTYRKALI
jgi:hypothetical protein